MSIHPPNAKGDDRINIVEQHVFVRECSQMYVRFGGWAVIGGDGMDVSFPVTATKWTKKKEKKIQKSITPVWSDIYYVAQTLETLQDVLKQLSEPSIQAWASTLIAFNVISQCANSNILTELWV